MEVGSWREGGLFGTDMDIEEGEVMRRVAEWLSG